MQCKTGMKHKQKYWHVWGKPSRDSSKTQEQNYSQEKEETIESLCLFILSICLYISMDVCLYAYVYTHTQAISLTLYAKELWPGSWGQAENVLLLSYVLICTFFFSV